MSDVQLTPLHDSLCGSSVGYALRWVRFLVAFIVWRMIRLPLLYLFVCASAHVEVGCSMCSECSSIGVRNNPNQKHTQNFWGQASHVWCQNSTSRYNNRKGQPGIKGGVLMHYCLSVCTWECLQQGLTGYWDRVCLKNTGMRPPGYVVRMSLENHTQQLTCGQIGRTNTVAPCEAAVIHLLSPNACSTLPLSMMHRDENNVNRHLKLFSCDKDQRKKHGS